MQLTRIGHGDLIAVAHSDVFMVLRALPGTPAVEKDLGVHLWHALNSERGIQKAISLLAQGSLETMPEFALVHSKNDSIHAIVRGSFEVMLLNHDGRYSKVGSESMATWREYARLSAAEWCIQSKPGSSINDLEPFYLSSGVSRISVIASLGWDDPETPENAAELRETGALSRTDLADYVKERRAAEISDESAGLVGPGSVPAVSAPVPVPPPATSSAAFLADPPGFAEKVSSVPVPQLVAIEELVAAQGAGLPMEAESSPIAPGPATISMPIINGDIVELPDALVAQLPPSVQQLSDAPTQILEPIPFLESTPFLEPIDGPGQVGVAFDEENTVLTNNLVEIRAAMESSPETPELLGAITETLSVLVPFIVMSNGVRVALDRSVLIGRAPEAARVSLRELPRLVNVMSPNNDVSRTHAQVRVNDGIVLVTDLNSTNGVFLIEPGLAPRRLHPDEPTQLLPGVTVDLGDGVSFELEVSE